MKTRILLWNLSNSESMLCSESRLASPSGQAGTSLSLTVTLSPECSGKGVLISVKFISLLN
jgi:hypothetical protein